MSKTKSFQIDDKEDLDIVSLISRKYLKNNSMQLIDKLSNQTISLNY